MKKIIISIIALSFMFLIGCDDEKKDFPYNYPDGAGLETSGGVITVLDNELTFNLTVKDPECTKVKVVGVSDTIKGVELGNINIESGKGSIKLSSENLKIAKVGDKSVVQFITNISNSASYDREVEIESAFSKVIEPEMVHKDTIYHFGWELKPYEAKVNKITVEKKVGELAAYQKYTTEFKQIDSIPLEAKKYNLLDTIYLRVIAYANTNKTDTLEKKIVVESFADGVEATKVTLKSKVEESVYSFIKKDYVEATSDMANIQFTSDNTGDIKIGFKALGNIEFVMSTKEIYDSVGTVALKMANFDTPLTMNDNLKGGEVYSFRIEQAGGDYVYGIMKIIKVDKPQGVLNDSYFTIEFKM